MENYLVNMQGICKSFGKNQVLKSVDFQLQPGSIHALLGENGTGKSTLMNILSGILPYDSGTIRVADGAGIAFIHQELALVNDLSIAENLFLGNMPKNGLFADRASMRNQTNEILKKMNVELDADMEVGELNASHKQIIEIARALLKDAKIIIMDEPTTALTDVEIAYIFEIMRSLRDKGVSLIFISHKLNEVVEICDSFTIMRDGVVVETGTMSPEITENVLARHMVGRELKYDDIYVKRNIGETILSIEDLCLDRTYSHVNMKVRKGEIVGVTGLLGDGRSELFETVYGNKKGYTGNITIDGKTVRMNSTTQAKSMGICYVPRNRKENGIIKDMSISENMSLAILKELKNGLFIHSGRQRENNEKYVKELNIKLADLEDSILSLSGGNQQKVVLAKALGPKPELVILDNPTQGVDIGAKLEIYHIIMELAAQGTSFVVLSSEAQEIMMLSDRVYVMFHGEVRKEFARDELSEENIMVVATGGTL
ncbi:MAG: sugar ABC transporter ATP-binding protein [Blautia sp.]|nr:sugar ABC transporter ATP-binding protein [Blautia sp.]